MKKKDRMKLDPVDMPEQDATKRVRNVDEVPLGYTIEMAMQEAKRCIQCKRPFCTEGCPVGIDIPGFIQLIEDGNFEAAVAKIKETNLLPAICGRVCPQEEQCQLTCTIGKYHKDPTLAVNIGRLERFLADWERENGEVPLPPKPKPTGKKVAIVGGGPAGLTVAGDLIRHGHQVTVFEAFHKAGGVLIYGIPEFRLPKKIVQKEVDYLEQLGVEFKYNFVVGKTAPVQKIIDDYDAVFIGTGAGLPRFMRIPGENLLGVYSANEYLTRANLMQAYSFPETDTPLITGRSIATVGGGNVAMDCARTALRMGAKRSLIIYRRAEEQMPARIEEVHHAKAEGVEFHTLQNPLRFLGNDDNWLTGVELLKMELGEPDASGRRSPVPIPDSEFIEEIDAVIVAIGNSPNPLVPRDFPALDVTKWGGIVVNEATSQTNIPGVFAGGDIVLGAATVILAMGHGRQAAKSINMYLNSGRWSDLEEALSTDRADVR